MSSFNRLTAAALVLVAVIGMPDDAAAGDTATTTVCSTGKRALFRHAAPQGRSVQIPRRVEVLERCDLDPEKRVLVLASYLDAAGGEALIKGRAQRAIRQIDSHEPSVGELINLCVAHTALRQWSAAETSCDAAVTAAERARAAIGRWPQAQRRIAEERVAVAYSNRAVMNWLSDDTGSAWRDLAQARALAPKAAFVVRNSELTVRTPAQIPGARWTASIG